MSAYKIVHCIFCKAFVRRKVRHTGDAAMFCSRDCSYSHASQQSKLRKLIVAEVKSLRAIAHKVKRQKKCRRCSKIIFFKSIQLCASCRSVNYQISRNDYKKTEKYKSLKRKHKSVRRARIRGGKQLESFDPFEIFDRDNWHCKACGVQTPKNKRGSFDDDAPELDHVVPLSKGGVHTRGNTQCLCRKCNGSKSDTV